MLAFAWLCASTVSLFAGAGLVLVVRRWDACVWVMNAADLWEEGWSGGKRTEGVEAKSRRRPGVDSV